MSEDNKTKPQNEEVDLVQLFNMIGKVVSRFFKFIRGVLNSLFLAFVWLVFFFREKIIFLIVSIILGAGLGFYFQKTTKPVYVSNFTIKQNYDTGETLYKAINYYNDLVFQNDFKTLNKSLGINTSDSEAIIGFNIEPVVTENQKLQAYNLYLKTLDSTAASKIEYASFVKNNKDYNYEDQQIIIKASNRSNFKTVFNSIITNIENNVFFKRLQEKQIVNLEHKKTNLEKILIQSDSLQNTYKRVLETTTQKSNSEVGITIEGNSNESKTKEYDLLLNDLKLRREIVDIEKQRKNKESIIEVVSSRQESGAIQNEKQLFGFKIGLMLYYIVICFAMTLLVLLSFRFFRFLEKFKDKI